MFQDSTELYKKKRKVVFEFVKGDPGVLTVSLHHCDADGCECTVDPFIIETQPMLYKMGI
jgi:hypothetical protein